MDPLMQPFCQVIMQSKIADGSAYLRLIFMTIDAQDDC